MGQIVQRQKRLRTLRFSEKLEFHQLFASHLHRAMEIDCPECLKIIDLVKLWRKFSFVGIE